MKPKHFSSLIFVVFIMLFSIYVNQSSAQSSILESLPKIAQSSGEHSFYTFDDPVKDQIVFDLVFYHEQPANDPNFKTIVYQLLVKNLSDTTGYWIDDQDYNSINFAMKRKYLAEIDGKSFEYSPNEIFAAHYTTMADPNLSDLHDPDPQGEYTLRETWGDSFGVLRPGMRSIPPRMQTLIQAEKIKIPAAANNIRLKIHLDPYKTYPEQDVVVPIAADQVKPYPKDMFIDPINLKEYHDLVNEQYDGYYLAVLFPGESLSLQPGLIRFDGFEYGSHKGNLEKMMNKVNLSVTNQTDESVQFEDFFNSKGIIFFDATIGNERGLLYPDISEIDPNQTKNVEVYISKNEDSFGYYNDTVNLFAPQVNLEYQTGVAPFCLWYHDRGWDSRVSKSVTDEEHNILFCSDK